MAKKLDSKPKRTVSVVRGAKRSTTSATTKAPKKTAKSAQTATQRDPAARCPKAKTTKSKEATVNCVGTALNPRRTAQSSSGTVVVSCGIEPTFEQIRNRAYQIYLQRNGGPGDAASDWLRAEQELCQVPMAQSVGAA